MLPLFTGFDMDMQRAYGSHRRLALVILSAAKNDKSGWLSAFITCLSLLCGCGYDDFDAARLEERDAPVPNITLASLRTHYHDAAFDITGDMVAQGRVVSSDAAGNFYRTVFIEDETGGAEIKAGLYDLHSRYPVGQRVVVRLAGLAADVQSGVLQIGARAPSYAQYRTDYFANSAQVEKYMIREGMPSPSAPRTVGISSLGVGMCGCLVRVQGVRLVGATPSAVGFISPVTWANLSDDPRYPHTDGYRKFKDAAGDSLLVATRGYAVFAGAAVPENVCDLTGVLSYGTATGSAGKPMYILRLRSLGDVTQ